MSVYIIDTRCPEKITVIDITLEDALKDLQWANRERARARNRPSRATGKPKGRPKKESTVSKKIEIEKID